LGDLNNIQRFTTGHPGKDTPFGDASDFAAMPGTHQAQMAFLDVSAKKFIHELLVTARIMTGNVYDPFAKGNFKTVDSFTGFSRTGPLADALRKWVYRRGVPFAREVFVVPNYNDYPVLTTWKMVVKYAPELFNHDDIAVFDRSLSWCLFCFHEGEVFFGRDPFYDPAEDEEAIQKLNERKQKYPDFRHPFQ
jgi:hypothetical protein